MALIDYKFWYIRRNDNGFITEAALRFFTGDITTELENGVNITRYRRTLRLGQTAVQFLGFPIIFDSAGNPTVLLKPSQFGNIKTDAELRSYCNTQLARFITFTPIAEQT